jgi:ferrous iron transport protein B
VYYLLTAVFLTEGFAWWVPGMALFGLYMIGFVVAPVVALLLKRTLLRGAVPLFVMELPAYRRPSVLAVARRMAGAGWAFVRRAGTLILASMVLVWGLLYFPHTDAQGQPYEERVAAADGAEANHLRGEWQRQSFLGRAGRALEPAFEPLGWDWRIGMAALASFPAREVVVGTLGIVYDQGDVAGEEQEATLRGAIREHWSGDPVRGRYPVAVALSVMVFFALCCQCASTLAVIRRETRSWAWPAFTFAYMTALAYVGALVTFQVGRLVTDLAA